MPTKQNPLATELYTVEQLRTALLRRTFTSGDHLESVIVTLQAMGPYAVFDEIKGFIRPNSRSDENLYSEKAIRMVLARPYKEELSVEELIREFHKMEIQLNSGPHLVSREDLTTQDWYNQIRILESDANNEEVWANFTDILFINHSLDAKNYSVYVAVDGKISQVIDDMVMVRFKEDV